MSPRRFLGGGVGGTQENKSSLWKRFLLSSHALPVCHARPSANFHKTLKTCRFLKSCIKCAVEVKTRTNETVKEMRTHGRNKDWGDLSPPLTTNPEDSASWKPLAGAGAAFSCCQRIPTASSLYFWYKYLYSSTRCLSTALCEQESGRFPRGSLFPFLAASGFPATQQKIEFHDVSLIKLKVVHESANAMNKTFLLKSCS